MLSKQAFFLLEFLIAFVIFTIFALIFLNFLNLTMRTKFLAKLRADNLSQLIQYIESGSIDNNMENQDLYSKYHKISLNNKGDFFDFIVYKKQIKRFNREQTVLLVASP